ncbi:E3 ubiquitin-protein ligase XIAP-like [Penaeus monodon]|uniref:E3 ubiquitin-protein ligase XIAP-like n=1 Tax=Penaeus monodon TaxID=6687 RepID=UPI0018A77FCC|nr:E3 ubiquitin-protein ligase XIAP-like [Penaeus monodon]
MDSTIELDVWYPLHVLYIVYTCIILRVCVLIYKQQSASLLLHTTPFLLAVVLILASIRSELLALPRLLYRRVATSCDSRFIFLPAGRVRNSFECLRHTVVHAASTSLEELEAEKARLKARLEETREALVCRVCLDRPVGAVFMPCAHLSTCHSCSASLTMCPLCRTPIHYAAAVIID